ncbi:Transcription factor iws1 [Dissophora ornata]|nr:Transcription factor iws1 [Dissophora ornata]
MSSDQKRTVRDIFGDEDEDEDDLTHEDRNNSNDRDDRQDASFKDGAEEEDAEEDEDEENEGIALPSFKKRNADGGSPAPEPKKRKTVKKPKAAKGESQDAEGGDDLPLDPRQKALLQLEKDFELAMKSGRSKTRRHNKDEVDLENELDGSASKFAAKMREAAFADIDSKLKHQPALAKVRMLESVKQQLNKSHLHSTFLENGILEAMKLWLEPLQDASLPSLDIIQDFLNLLDILPIQKDQLISSGVGRVVFFYTKVDDSRVTPSIKRKANSLVDKWSSQIVKLSQDYKDKPINYSADNLNSSPQRRRHDPSSANSASEIPMPKTLGVRVPQIDRGSYTFMPESSITYDKSRGGKLLSSRNSME